MSALLELIPLFKRLHWHEAFAIGLACARPFKFVVKTLFVKITSKIMNYPILLLVTNRQSQAVSENYFEELEVNLPPFWKRKSINKQYPWSSSKSLTFG